MTVAHRPVWFALGGLVKRFSCGDVVPGCHARFEGRTEHDILSAVARHAAEVHQMPTVPDDIAALVRSRILAVA